MSVLSKLLVKLDKHYIVSKKAQRCLVLAEQSELSFDELYDGATKSSSFVRGQGLARPAVSNKAETERKLETTRLSQQIYETYNRNQEKPGFKAFKKMMRESRKFGYPIVFTLEELCEAEQLSVTAKLLLKVSESWPDPALPWPDVIELEEGTVLYEDSVFLLSVSRRLGSFM